MRIKKIQKRTWYGVTATVTIGPGFIHWAGWGNLLIPHPPIANWLLRQKLSDSDRKALSVAHEFQHLQSAPFYFIYTLVMLAFALLEENVKYSDIFIVFISSHAAWEILSETLTFFHNIQLYLKSYTEIPISPRLVFWVVNGIFAVVGWAFIL